MKNNLKSEIYKFRIWKFIDQLVPEEIIGPERTKAKREQMLKLAEAVSTSEKNMYRIASAKIDNTIDMNSDKLVKVAEFFNVPIHEILNNPPTLNRDTNKKKQQELAAA